MKPEDLTYKIYSRFTAFRVLIFYLLLIFVVINLIFPFNIFPSIKSELFINALNSMIQFLIIVEGAIVVAFFPVALQIMIEKRKSEEVTDLWLKIAKYIIYPFSIIILIEMTLFLKEYGIDIPKTSLSFTLLLLFGYLTINSVYVLVKDAETLIDEGWIKKEKTSPKIKQDIKNLPPSLAEPSNPLKAD